VGASLDAANLARVSLWKVLGTAVLYGWCRLPPPKEANLDSGQSLDLLATATYELAGDLSRFTHPCLREVANIPPGKLRHLQNAIYAVEYYDPLGLDDDPEPVHPLLSQPLIELCLQLPSYLLIHGGRDRGLARYAFSRNLPPQVVGRRSKGGMQEHMKDVISRDIAFVRTLLLDGILAKTGLLDREKLEDSLYGRPSSTTSSVRELHTYMGIEAWLQRWTSVVTGNKLNAPVVA
jgi:asparagine synthase (glutamine-hydrolysing)